MSFLINLFEVEGNMDIIYEGAEMYKISSDYFIQIWWGKLEMAGGCPSFKSEPLWVAPWVESKVHVALRVDWEGSVDSEDSNIEQDGIELLHKMIKF